MLYLQSFGIWNVRDSKKPFVLDDNIKSSSFVQDLIQENTEVCALQSSLQIKHFNTTFPRVLRE